MKCNVGKTDRIIRIVLGLIIAVLGIIMDSWWGLVGFVPLITGIFAFCPAYFFLNINTGSD